MNSIIFRWRSDEQRFNKFPFKMEQQFKIAIANTEEDFVVAVNGKLHCRYQYRNENIFEILTGLKFTVEKGLQIEVTGVDHMNMGMADCEGFETYSHPDVRLE